MDPAWIALIGTLIGGPVAVKIVDFLLNRGNKRDELSSKLREELRKETDGLRSEAAKLREEIRTVEKELDNWKLKYYELLQQYIENREVKDDEAQGKMDKQGKGKGG